MKRKKRGEKHSSVYKKATLNPYIVDMVSRRASRLNHLGNSVKLVGQLRKRSLQKKTLLQNQRRKWSNTDSPS